MPPPYFPHAAHYSRPGFLGKRLDFCPEPILYFDYVVGELNLSFALIKGKKTERKTTETRLSVATVLLKLILDAGLGNYPGIVADILPKMIDDKNIVSLELLQISLAKL